LSQDEKAQHTLSINEKEAGMRCLKVAFSLSEVWAKKANDDSEMLIVFRLFPNYKIGVTEEEILKQREYVDTVIGHSHPPEEFFTIKEFSTAFSTEPIRFDQTPMLLSEQSEDETTLMANLAVFKVNDIVV